MSSATDYNAFEDGKDRGKPSPSTVSFGGVEPGSDNFDPNPIKRTKTWQERVQKRIRGAAEEDDDLMIHSVGSYLSDFTHMTEMTDVSAMKEAEAQARREQGIEDWAEEKEGLKDPQGFFVVCAVILAGDMARGVLFPTLWPLLQQVGGTKSHHGFIVAATSLGRILSSPTFGTASVKYGYRPTLLVAQIILLIGSFLYTFTVQVNKPIYLFVSMLCIGLGSGTLGVTRAFVADICPKEKRTTYIAYLTSVQYGGFTITPFLGSLYVDWFEDKPIDSLFGINMYTAPSYTMITLCILNLVLLYFFLSDRKREKPNKIYKTVPSHVKRAAQPECVRVGNQKVSWLCGITTLEAVFAFCMFLNIISKGSFGAFEAIGVMLAEDSFGKSSDQAGYTIAVFGVVGVLFLLSMEKIEKVMNDIQMMWVGTITMTFGALIMSQYPTESFPLPSFRYYLGIFCVYGFGYPIGHTACIGLFSKLIRNQPQGTLQGWFATSGSVARVIFPISSCLIYAGLGSTVLFAILATLTLGAVIAIISAGDLLTLLST